MLPSNLISGKNHGLSSVPGQNDYRKKKMELNFTLNESVWKDTVNQWVVFVEYNQ